MSRILANATVEQIGASPFTGDPFWGVTVTGDPPHAETRHYQISKKSDNEAAMAGISMFVAEMEAGPND